MLTICRATVCMGEYTHHKSIGQDDAIVPCSDMCGVVTQAGEGVTALKPGDRVLSTFLPDHQTGQVTEKELTRGLGLPLDGVLATHQVFLSLIHISEPTRPY